MSESSKLIKLGWAGYVLVWLLLFANIAYDWLVYRWISPLSILVFLILGGGSLVMRWQGKPIVTTEGMKTRIVVLLFGLLVIASGIMIYWAWRALLG